MKWQLQQGKNVSMQKKRDHYSEAEGREAVGEKSKFIKNAGKEGGHRTIDLKCAIGDLILQRFPEREEDVDRVSLSINNSQENHPARRSANADVKYKKKRMQKMLPISIELS